MFDTILATLKTTNFIAFFRADPLDSLKHKASAIASHFDSGFDRKQDGIILQF